MHFHNVIVIVAVWFKKVCSSRKKRISKIKDPASTKCIKSIEVLITFNRVVRFSIYLAHSKCLSNTI